MDAEPGGPVVGLSIYHDCPLEGAAKRCRNKADRIGGDQEATDKFLLCCALPSLKAGKIQGEEIRQASRGRLTGKTGTVTALSRERRASCHSWDFGYNLRIFCTQ